METGHRLFARQDDAGLCRFLTYVVGEHLIDGDARFDNGAFLNDRARQKTSGLRGMNSVPDGAFMEQAVNDIDFVFERLQRHQRLAELHGRTGTLGVPMVFVHAVAHEQDGETFGKPSVAAPQAFRDSSQGKATVTPARRTVRREIRDVGFRLRMDMEFISPCGRPKKQCFGCLETRAGNDAFRRLLNRYSLASSCDRMRSIKGSSEMTSDRLSAKDAVCGRDCQVAVLAVLPDIGLNTRKTGGLDAAR